MSDKMMAEMKRRLREIMKGKPVGSPNSKEVEDMIVQVGKDMGVFKSDTPKKMKDGGKAISDRDKMKMGKWLVPKRREERAAKLFLTQMLRRLRRCLKSPRKPRPTDKLCSLRMAARSVVVLVMLMVVSAAHSSVV